MLEKPITHQGQWYPTPPYPPHPKMLDNQNSDSYTFGCPPGGKIMQGPLRGFHQDLHSTFSYGPLQHLGQDLHILGTAPSNSCKIVIEGPDQISLPGSHRIKNQHRATARVVWHAQSAERIVRAISKLAPCHKESDLPRAKCRNGCASEIQIRTAPQREQPERHKVPRGLCERYQNWHRATRRAICHVQSAETVARARSKFAPRHSESNLTGTKRREGCASDIKIGTMPQGERSATCKVPKRLRERDPNSAPRHNESNLTGTKCREGLCERYQIWHRATRRAICHVQSAETVARARSKFAPRTTTRATWQAQSAEKVVRAISKLAPCHKESDLPRAKCRKRLRERDPNSHRATTRATWQAQSAEKVVRVISNLAPCHKESDLPRAKCRNGCASEIQIRTAPQREQPDRHKVPRRLCERYQNWHHATRRAICHVQSAETVARARSKFAPRHNESNLTGTKCREGCASDIKIGTVPQGERSATCKVPKRLRERDPNSHRATTRAIRHAQSHESLARAQNRFLQNIAHTTKNEHWKCQSRCFTEVPFLFAKMSRRNLKCCTCHTESSSCPKSKMTVSQNEAF